MIITAIRVRSGRMADVETEDEGCFALTMEELYDAGLKLTEEDEEVLLSVPEETAAMIRTALHSRALMKCGDLLKNQDYTEKKLRDKLAGSGFPDFTISEVTMEMKKAHYLDDLRFAQNYIRYHLSDKSLNRIRQDLYTRGVSEETMEQAFAEASEEEGGENGIRDRELDQIRTLLRKRRYDPENADWSEKQKTEAFLYRRGFSTDRIREAMNTAVDIGR